MNILDHHNLTVVYILDGKKYYYRGKCNEKQFMLCDIETRSYYIFNIDDYKVVNGETDPSNILRNMVINVNTEGNYYLIPKV
jgi:hypothetical protein